MSNPSVAVIGSLTHIGQAVLACLSERGFPTSHVYALDAHHNAGTLIPYCNTFLTVEALDDFDFSTTDLVFLCVASILSEYKEEATRHGCWLIDCTGLLSQAPVIIPNLNIRQADKAPNRQIANPTSTTVTLAQILSPIHRSFHIENASVTALLSASEFGIDSAQALIDQTRCLYTRQEPPIGPFRKIQAFNLIPEADPRLTRRSMQQLSALLSFPIFVTGCLTPILLGECYAVTLTTKRPCSPKRLRHLFNKQPCCHVLEKTMDYITITTQDVETEDRIFIEHPTSDITTPHILHFWVVSDSIRTGAALNAVKIAEHLLS